MHRPTLRDFRRLTDHAEFSEDDARYDTSRAAYLKMAADGLITLPAPDHADHSRTSGTAPADGNSEYLRRSCFGITTRPAPSMVARMAGTYHFAE